MYRVTFTSLIAVSLLLVFVHSIRDFGIEDGEGPVNNPPNRFNSQTVGRVNSPTRGVPPPLFKPKPFGINKGGDGGAGSVQVQQGDGGKSRISGGSGGRGGFVKGTGSQNTGGTGGSGSVQLQQGAGGVSETSGGNGGDGGGVLRKRRFSFLSSSNEVPSPLGQNIGGRGGDGSVQIQSQDGSSNSVSGGSGGAGGSVFGPEPSFSSSFSSGQSATNIQENVSAKKRHFFPSRPVVNQGGKGGDGNVQIQGGFSNDVSGGNGGAGGSISRPQSSFRSSQSVINSQNNFSGDKRGLGSNNNGSSFDLDD